MAFVHLHNHSDFSILDGATRISDMVKTVVNMGMPALALTDHGYMFGVPNFDLECRKYNESAPNYRQWQSDIAAFKEGTAPEEPASDAPGAPAHECVHAQWEADVAAWEASGELDSVKACRPAPRIKPIFGCEAYFVPDECISRGTTQHRYHLILLAKNETGYVNLMKMMSEAASGEMFYYRPRTSLDMLRRYHEGIICTSACVSGIVPRMIVEGRPEEARKWALTYKEIFGEDFYLEIQDHGLADPKWGGLNDRAIAEKLVELGRELDIKVVATNDNHYLTRDDAPTQDILSCIGTNAKLDDTMRKRMSGTEFYIKSEDEMRKLFSWCPEAIENTVEIANKCSYELDWTHIYLPKFPDLNPGETSEERFRKECEEGLARRYGPEWQTLEIAGQNVKERFEYEFSVICQKGFADYFLIVQEYVRWARSQGIGVGPGRGSAAGSIVAYAMEITGFDPLENGLMFERFLSLERSEMPDIDMDFDDERRLEVVEHVRQLYGPERVCHVITYSTIKAKQAINDAARVLNYPVSDGQRLSKMLANDPRLLLNDALSRTSEHPERYSPDFENAYNENEESRRIIEAALAIEGCCRGEGVHACAVLITPTPVNDHVPTKIDTKGGVEITQYEGGSVASMGLLKMDFLGLRTLTVISKTLENIRKNHGIEIDVDAIPFDDPEIFRLMREGRTAGVFQVESAGMTSTIKNMRPSEYKHVVALIALYRPGPLGAGMVSDYIERMNGRKEVVFYDDRLSEILNETYGTMVYQEQVMQISMKMSGFSAGESDSRIRKPVAKKKIKLLTSTVYNWEDGAEETTYDHWMNGAVRNGYKKEVAERIWSDVLEFASYAFNKSHSAGYAILVMQTAWLKAHYPLEYAASVLTSYMGKTDKIAHYIASYNHEGIAILPPDINESGRDFTATKDGVRFGFGGIRGVGEGVADTISAEREARGPFRDLHDFVRRVDTHQANRRVIEALILSGAFDSTGYTRMQLMRFVDKTNPNNIIDMESRAQKVRATGQLTMFDLFADVEGSGFEHDVPEPDGIEWDRSVKLAREREVLGLYVSDHPLRPYEYALNRARDWALSDIVKVNEVATSEGGVQEEFVVPEGEVITLAGMLTNVVRRPTRRGDLMATATLEDLEGELQIVVFPKLYEKISHVLAGNVNPETGSESGDLFVQVKGRLERSDRGDQFMCSWMEPLVFTESSNRPRVLEAHMPIKLLIPSRLEELGRVLQEHPGDDQVELRVESTSGESLLMELPMRVDTADALLLAEVTDLVGPEGLVRVI